METDLPRWVALLISAMLVTPFLVALFVVVRHHWRARTWARAEATVTKRRSEISRQGDGSTSTTTTVTFTFADMTERDRTGTAVNPAGEPRLGDVLEVMYDPQDPDRSRVVELGRRYVVMLAVFALLFALGVWSVFVPLG
ncbi:hypothetical protein CFH99_24370 [Nocardioides aromaticivorans]|uniref:DUF3592 domain-containing protein n=1 Tax=Nocardioides aromaticivorans TaxID=200618 RepID=A0ABX7PRX4_9ACTN|nr:DUF3592 domain-containing protein [Nocardioides aromaticivorans]QSR28761.1 hypothetical protein CFH99_24370 [Nocardioides aromaticivorans]